MKLKQLDILGYDVSCCATLLVSPQLVVDLDYVSQLVGQVILQCRNNSLLVRLANFHNSSNMHIQIFSLTSHIIIQFGVIILPGYELSPA